MISDKHIRFGYLLITWYRHNLRQLPWRETRDPYAIWLSEIILQQTRIQQGLSYYKRFLEAFPNVEDLAKVPVDEVLKLWQGLGYYTRARNLHETARVIQSSYKGVFPADYQSIKKLKGIGDYTAAAIASICFGLPYPVLDGNVYRVMTRYLSLDEPVNSSGGKKKVLSFLEQHILTDHPGDFNQALMELGALVCTPQNPDCLHCPLNQWCEAHLQNKVDQFPVAARKRESKVRYFNYIKIIEVQNDIIYTYLTKRMGDDIWKGLYEFPLVETNERVSSQGLMDHSIFKKYFAKGNHGKLSHSMEMKHILTHQTLLIRFFILELAANKSLSLPADWIQLSLADIHTYPVSRLTEKFLESSKGK